MESQEVLGKAASAEAGDRPDATEGAMGTATLLSRLTGPAFEMFVEDFNRGN